MGNTVQANPQCYWTVLDTLGKVLYSKKNTTTGFLKSNLSAAVRSNAKYQFNNKVFYWNHYNDTIFQLNDTSYEAAYLFKQDKYRLTPENSIVEENLVGNNQYYSTSFVTESQRYLFLLYRQNKKNHFCIYDKQEDVFMNNASNENRSLKNDIDGGLPFLPKQYITVNGIEYLLNQIEAIELKAHVASEAFKTSNPKYPEKKRELEKLANSLNNNDNPVLMLVKLKE